MKEHRSTPLKKNDKEAMEEHRNTPLKKNVKEAITPIRANPGAKARMGASIEVLDINSSPEFLHTNTLCSAKSIPGKKSKSHFTTASSHLESDNVVCFRQPRTLLSEPCKRPSTDSVPKRSRSICSSVLLSESSEFPSVAFSQREKKSIPPLKTLHSLSGEVFNENSSDLTFSSKTQYPLSSREDLFPSAILEQQPSTKPHRFSPQTLDKKCLPSISVVENEHESIPFTPASFSKSLLDISEEESDSSESSRTESLNFSSQSLDMDILLEAITAKVNKSIPIKSASFSKSSHPTFREKIERSKSLQNESLSFSQSSVMDNSSEVTTMEEENKSIIVTPASFFKSSHRISLEESESSEPQPNESFGISAQSLNMNNLTEMTTVEEENESTPVKQASFSKSSYLISQEDLESSEPSPTESSFSLQSLRMDNLPKATALEGQNKLIPITPTSFSKRPHRISQEERDLVKPSLNQSFSLSSQSSDRDNLSEMTTREEENESFPIKPASFSKSSHRFSQEERASYEPPPSETYKSSSQFLDIDDIPKLTIREDREEENESVPTKPLSFSKNSHQFSQKDSPSSELPAAESFSFSSPSLDVDTLLEVAILEKENESVPITPASFSESSKNIFQEECESSELPPTESFKSSSMDNIPEVTTLKKKNQSVPITSASFCKSSHPISQDERVSSELPASESFRLSSQSLDVNNLPEVTTLEKENEPLPVTPASFSESSKKISQERESSEPSPAESFRSSSQSLDVDNLTEVNTVKEKKDTIPLTIASSSICFHQIYKEHDLSKSTPSSTSKPRVCSNASAQTLHSEAQELLNYSSTVSQTDLNKITRSSKLSVYKWPNIQYAGNNQQHFSSNKKPRLLPLQINRLKRKPVFLSHKAEDNLFLQKKEDNLSSFAKRKDFIAGVSGKKRSKWTSSINEKDCTSAVRNIHRSFSDLSKSVDCAEQRHYSSSIEDTQFCYNSTKKSVLPSEPQYCKEQNPLFSSKPSKGISSEKQLQFIFASTSSRNTTMISHPSRKRSIESYKRKLSSSSSEGISPLYGNLPQPTQSFSETMNRNPPSSILPAVETLKRKPLCSETQTSQPMKRKLSSFEPMKRKLPTLESMKRKLPSSESMKRKLPSLESMKRKLPSSESMRRKLTSPEGLLGTYLSPLNFIDKVIGSSLAASSVTPEILSTTESALRSRCSTSDIVHGNETPPTSLPSPAPAGSSVTSATSRWSWCSLL